MLTPRQIQSDTVSSTSMTPAGLDRPTTGAATALPPLPSLYEQPGPVTRAPTLRQGPLETGEPEYALVKRDETAEDVQAAAAGQSLANLAPQYMAGNLNRFLPAMLAGAQAGRGGPVSWPTISVGDYRTTVYNYGGGGGGHDGDGRRQGAGGGWKAGLWAFLLPHSSCLCITLLILICVTLIIGWLAIQGLQATVSDTFGWVATTVGVVSGFLPSWGVSSTPEAPAGIIIDSATSVTRASHLSTVVAHAILPYATAVAARYNNIHQQLASAAPLAKRILQDLDPGQLKEFTKDRQRAIYHQFLDLAQLGEDVTEAIVATLELEQHQAAIQRDRVADWIEASENSGSFSICRRRISSWWQWIQFWRDNTEKTPFSHHAVKDLTVLLSEATTSRSRLIESLDTILPKAIEIRESVCGNSVVLDDAAKAAVDQRKARSRGTWLADLGNDLRQLGDGRAAMQTLCQFVQVWGEGLTGATTSTLRDIEDIKALRRQTGKVMRLLGLVPSVLDPLTSGNGHGELRNEMAYLGVVERIIGNFMHISDSNVFLQKPLQL